MAVVVLDSILRLTRTFPHIAATVCVPSNEFISRDRRALVLVLRCVTILFSVT